MQAQHVPNEQREQKGGLGTQCPYVLSTQAKQTSDIVSQTAPLHHNGLPEFSDGIILKRYIHQRQKRLTPQERHIYQEWIHTLLGKHAIELCHHKPKVILPTRVVLRDKRITHDCRILRLGYTWMVILGSTCFWPMWLCTKGQAALHEGQATFVESPGRARQDTHIWCNYHTREGGQLRKAIGMTACQ
eukprot:Blabericola_migrator_1__2562@NODE_1724_length_3921_cov_660_524131_g1114_i0_p2_GENE_NODE_1724_length_3921_cov_660_524131_g1114_i0NODE_1724_length_3921_cov_660_524131_g1114_i0_p2_ORF_typecomplete_len188_score6_47_NODE_1724_length_3921_cov_660_524131_g1114_i010411604